MTMPSERRRALRWCRSTLHELGSDPGAPADIKEDIESLLSVFPSDRDIATCFLERYDGDLVEVLDAIRRAHDILLRARRCAGLSEEVRRAAVVTERHFPQRFEMPSGGWRDSPREWIKFYLLRDLEPEDLRAELKPLGFDLSALAAARLEATRQTA